MVDWSHFRIRHLLRPKSLSGGVKTARKLVAILLLTVVLLTFVTTVWRVIRTPVEQPTPASLVNDVTQLNPIAVSEVITPTTTEEIVEAVKQHRGPIAMGGARSSMGGQTVTEGALHMARRTSPVWAANQTNRPRLPASVAKLTTTLGWVCVQIGRPASTVSPAPSSVLLSPALWPFPRGTRPPRGRTAAGNRHHKVP